MVEEVQTPTYCSVCGSRLITSNNVEGYDIFTGHPVKSSILDCPNVTTEKVGNSLLSRVRTTEHPSWSLVDGTWQSY